MGEKRRQGKLRREGVVSCIARGKKLNPIAVAKSARDSEKRGRNKKNKHPHLAGESTQRGRWGRAADEQAQQYR